MIEVPVCAAAPRAAHAIATTIAAARINPMVERI
jgi:hypothetical protein